MNMTLVTLLPISEQLCDDSDFCRYLPFSTDTRWMNSAVGSLLVGAQGICRIFKFVYSCSVNLHSSNTVEQLTLFICLIFFDPVTILCLKTKKKVTPFRRRWHHRGADFPREVPPSYRVFGQALLLSSQVGDISSFGVDSILIRYFLTSLTCYCFE